MPDNGTKVATGLWGDATLHVAQLAGVKWRRIR